MFTTLSQFNNLFPFDFRSEICKNCDIKPSYYARKLPSSKNDGLPKPEK